MKKLLSFAVLAVLFASFATGASAQEFQRGSYVITPAKEVHVGLGLGDFQVFDVWQENVDTTPITLGWGLLDMNLPAGWDYSMCDLGTCFGGIPDSAAMEDLPPGEKAFLGLNIGSDDNPGMGVVRCYVYDVRYPQNRDTITWLITSGTASVGATVATQPFFVGPNPTHGIVDMNFTSPFTGDVRVYDALGKLSATYPARGSNVKINLSNLPTGTYLLVAHDGSKIIGQQRIVRE